MMFKFIRVISSCLLWIAILPTNICCGDAVEAGLPVIDLPAPPMGFMSWERFRCQTDCNTHPNDCIDESLYQSMADALVDGGFFAAGYDHVNIDDCWFSPKGRDPQSGKLRPDPIRFPNGMEAIGKYLHDRGMKFGSYGDAGSKTCAGYPGSQHHQELDAMTFASWGVDYIKLDGCNLENYTLAYTLFGNALKKVTASTGRKLAYSCSWPAYIGDDESKKPFNDMFNLAGCNTWRNWHDIDNKWSSIHSIILHWANNWKALRNVPHGSYNDADMLLVGDDH